MIKIVADPGHYGYSSGAVGPTGVYERDVTMGICRSMLPLFTAKGYSTKLTRVPGKLHVASSVDQDLYTRVKIANDWGADLFVSVHCNASVNRTAHGMEVFTTLGQGKSDIIAEKVISSLVSAFPELTLRTDRTDGDRDKEENFYVLRKTVMPAILIETAFISNPTEEKLLKSSEGQARFARAITKGIISALG